MLTRRGPRGGIGNVELLSNKSEIIHLLGLGYTYIDIYNILKAEKKITITLDYFRKLLRKTKLRRIHSREFPNMVKPAIEKLQESINELAQMAKPLEKSESKKKIVKPRISTPAPIEEKKVFGVLDKYYVPEDQLWD